MKTIAAAFFLAFAVVGFGQTSSQSSQPVTVRVAT